MIAIIYTSPPYGPPYTAISGGGCGSTDPCTVVYSTWHVGIWGDTKVDVYRNYGGAHDTVTGTNTVCSQFDTIAGIRTCTLNAASNILPVSTTGCGYSETGNSKHEAWFYQTISTVNGVLDPTDRDNTIRKGVIDEFSTAPHLDLPPCTEDYPDDGYGGGGGDEECFDAYLVWYDDSGYETDEEYLGEYCCDSVYGCRAD